MRELLQRMALVVGRRARLVFLVTALLVAGSVGLATQLEFDTDVTSLLPQDDPTVQTFSEFVEKFGSLDLLLVAVRIPADVPVDPYQSFADELAAQLAELPEIEYVDHKLGSPEELIRAFVPRMFLFLDAAGLDKVGRKLEAEGMRQRAQELRRLVTTPQSMALESLLVLDPLGLTQVVLESFEMSTGAMAIDLSSGYYLSRDHRMLLILAKPVRPAQDIDFDEQLVAATNAASARVLSRWPELAESEPAPEVALGGGYLTALDDASLIKGDIITNALTSMAVVLLLFLWAFRRIGPLFFAFVPLSCGIALTFGFTALTMGTLSSATSGVAALLIGLAIDFVIVSYGRYVEERRAGASVARAIRQMNASSGRAVVVGGLTSAATFYAFLVTDFRGLEQMGILAGTGILLCMASVLILLPAMLVWSEERHRKQASRPHLYLHAFGTARLVRMSFAHPRAALALGAVVTGLLGWQAMGLKFQHDMRQMRSPHNRGIQVLDEVATHFGSGFEFMSLVVKGDDLGRVLEMADQAAEGARQLVQAGVLDGYESLTSLVPPPSQQNRALEWLSRHRQDVSAPRAARESLAAALLEAGLRPAPFGEGLDLLEQALSVDRPITVEDLENDPQSARLVERYLRRTDQGWLCIVKLFPPPKRWKREAPPEVLALAERLGPEVEATGVNVISNHLRGTVRRQAVVAAALGLVLVLGLLWLDFGRLSDSILSLAPLGVGVIWMLGMMKMAGIHVNLFNIFVTTMIIGIGVDYGIHAVHRYRERCQGEPSELLDGLLETGKAIALAALSTVVGFGSMSLSRYPGLRSVGLVAIMGAVATAFVAVTLLPAYMSLRMRRGREDRPG